jgi:hypothetical protein
MWKKKGSEPKKNSEAESFKHKKIKTPPVANKSLVIQQIPNSNY